MKVFLGWSGPRSKETAEALGDWLRQVIQAVDPWISSEISKGVRWENEIADTLEEAKVGIICLTRENLNENWILFEAGALSKTKDAKACTFLLDLTPADIKPPLAQFQHTKFGEKDVRKLVHTINEAVKDAGERSLDEKTLNRIFDHFWVDIEEELKKIVEKHAVVDQPIRNERDILEEILMIVRAHEERQRQKDHREILQTPPVSIGELVDEYNEKLRELKDKNKKIRLEELMGLLSTTEREDERGY